MLPSSRKEHRQLRQLQALWLSRLALVQQQQMTVLRREPWRCFQVCWQAEVVEDLEVLSCLEWQLGKELLFSMMLLEPPPRLVA